MCYLWAAPTAFVGLLLVPLALVGRGRWTWTAVRWRSAVDCSRCSSDGRAYSRHYAPAGIT